MCRQQKIRKYHDPLKRYGIYEIWPLLKWWPFSIYAKIGAKIETQHVSWSKCFERGKK